MEAHLSAVGAHTRIAKQTDLTQFSDFLSARGYLTIGDLGKRILPELNLLRGSFLDGLTLPKPASKEKRLR